MICGGHLVRPSALQLQRSPLERQALPSPTCQIQQVWEAAGKARNLHMNIFPGPLSYFWE